ncbi:hypothetical protein P7C70_g1762, partial [Phenoliferia sp. Uapishka_3]
MALRPPSTPRSLSISSTDSPLQPSAGSTPARRKSSIPLTPSTSSTLRASEIEAQLEALKLAMKANDPTRYESPIPGVDPNSFPVPGGSADGGGGAERKRLGLRKPSNLNLRATTSGSSTRPTTPVGPTSASLSATTSGTGTPRTPSHPRQSGRFAGPLPIMSPEKEKEKLEIGDEVKMEVGGVAMEGTLRFLGEVEGKDGNWAGVELAKEWEGQGKNDGSVRGAQYFACPPLCGLFLPLSKISLARPRPPLPATGSRASKYGTLTAKDLVSSQRRPSSRPSLASPASPTKAKLGRSTSPSKAPSSTSSSTSGTAASQSTPRAKPRMSMGIPTPRKSIGGGSLSASTNTTPRATRPGSSLRDYPPPPLPTGNHAFGRSITPSGRGTPSTPSATTAGRRMSLISHSSSIRGDESRPTTPSVRSYSRQSFASVSSSRGGGSVMGGDTEEWREKEREAREREKEAREREQEVRNLLEASERVGREMEGRLGEREREVRELMARVEEVERRAKEEREEREEQERAREMESAKAAAAVVVEERRDDDGAASTEADAARLADLERTLADMTKREEALRVSAERAAREFETKSAAKEGDIERMREILQDRDEERRDMEAQIDKLRGAGQALCETYEERISEIEGRRLEAEERLVELEMKIEGGEAAGEGHTVVRSAADVINAETAEAEVEHLRMKLGHLEEQLEDTRAHLEAEVADTKKRRQKNGEVELMLKKEVKTLREAIDKSAKSEARLTARIEELEDALAESQTALENERSELEGLRHDAHSTSSPDELTRAQKQVASLTRDAARSAELVAELREDLRAAEKEISASHLRAAGRKGSIDNSEAVRNSNSTPIQMPTQDTPNLLTSPRSNKRDSMASSSSRKSSYGPKDDVAALREQIVGLKVIIQTLTDDNQQLSDRNKSLMGESQELRDAQRSLETTVENLMNEMSSGAAPSAKALEDRRASRRLSTVPLQREVDELKSKLSEAEKKAEREIKALNQEVCASYQSSSRPGLTHRTLALQVTELESLVESKIYREDELELELEKFKSLVSKSGMSDRPLSSRTNGTSTASHSRNSSVLHDDFECEMCGEKGHDLDSCPEFGGTSTNLMKMTSSSLMPTKADGAEFCDDCEEYGHSLELCPMANEMF